MLDWTVLQHGMETLGSGFNPSAAKDWTSSMAGWRGVTLETQGFNSMQINATRSPM